MGFQLKMIQDTFGKVIARSNEEPEFNCNPEGIWNCSFSENLMGKKRKIRKEATNITISKYQIYTARWLYHETHDIAS